jgi:predicted patatin/cPLA2 family phospholipase
MRGVVSAGMTAALESLGLLPCFDVVYGASAGAMNGAYLVAGQAAFGMSIYYEDLNDRRFIDPVRYFTRRPMLALDYLLEEIVKREKVLDWERILSSEVALKVVAFSLTKRRTVTLGPYRDREHLFDSLRASATVPLVAGPPVSIDGDSLVDALLSEPVPFKSALSEGCTHVLCLLTRPRTDRPDKPTAYDRWIQAPRLKRRHPDLVDLYLRRPAEYAAEIGAVWRATDDPMGAPFVCAVAPAPAALPLDRLEKRQDRLFVAAGAGFRAMTAAVRGCPT